MNFSLRVFEKKTPVIGQGVYIDPTATVIGDVSLGADSSVWPMAVIRGDVNAIRIGESCSIQDGAILHVTHDGPFTPGGKALVLGNNITIGHQAVLHGCTIEDTCLIGMGALILDGAYIESQVILAAGSVVPPGKILQSRYLYLGNPAKAVRLLTEQEIQHLSYSAQHYVKLKNRYLGDI